MKKISVNKIIVDNSTIEEILQEYNSIKIAIKDSNVKLKELKKFISEEDLKKYILLKDNNSKELNDFLLEKPILSEFIDEKDYNTRINKKLEILLCNRIDLSKLSNGLECQHEFVKLNNTFMCVKCFIKDNDLDYQSEDLVQFLIDAALYQGSYIDELDESELGLLEQVKLEHKELINNLKQQMNSLPISDRENVEETINSLEKNKTTEYRNSLRKLRNKKLSIR